MRYYVAYHKDNKYYLNGRNVEVNNKVIATVPDKHTDLIEMVMYASNVADRHSHFESQPTNDLLTIVFCGYLTATNGSPVYLI